MPIDAGFAIGALLAGVVADLLELGAAIWVVAVAEVRMYETHRPGAAAPAAVAPPGPRVPAAPPVGVR